MRRSHAHVVDAALDAGINFFDTADIYDTGHSEEFLGRALGTRRRDVVIATKFGMKFDDTRPGGASPEYVRQAVEDSLRRLGTDYIDLYQLHQPDPNTPIADTLGALRNWCARAKSARSAAPISPPHRSAKAAGSFVSVQNQYNLFHREPEAEVLPECRRPGSRLPALFPAGQWTAHRQVSPGSAAAHGQPRRSRMGSQGFHRRESGEGGAPDPICRRARSFAAGAGLLLAGRPAHGGLGDRRRGRPQQIAANAAANWRIAPADLAEIDRLLA